MHEPINLQYTTIKEPVPDFIYEGIKDYSKAANVYQPQPQVLIDKLATKYHLPPELIFLTAGADEAIQLLGIAYGSNAYVFIPTYVVISDVELFGGKLTRLPSLKGEVFTIDTQPIPNASLIYLANPNNPSGFTSKESVMVLLNNNPGAVVVIDEAYGDFAHLSVIDEVSSHPNLVVIRSFSKGYALAGNRVGFMVANEPIKSKVSALAQWCNVSYLSIGAAVIALDHEDYYRSIRETIHTSRKDFYQFLKTKGYSVIDSLINAVVLRFDSEVKATQFVEYLQQHQVTVSHGNGNSNIGLDKSFVRIAIGTPIQMDQVKRIISGFNL
jgi:histidinol-phosphate aminotransferase